MKFILLLTTLALTPKQNIEVKADSGVLFLNDPDLNVFYNDVVKLEEKSFDNEKELEKNGSELHE